METLKLNKILNIKNRIETPIDEMQAIEKFTADVIIRLAKYLGLTKKEVIDVLPVSPKTIERLKKSIIKDLVLAEHLLHLAKVAKEGIDVFEDPAMFSKWLKTPHVMIKGLEPYEILRTLTGCNIIITILGRTKYGVYS